MGEQGSWTPRCSEKGESGLYPEVGEEAQDFREEVVIGETGRSASLILTHAYV